MADSPAVPYQEIIILKSTIYFRYFVFQILNMFHDICISIELFHSYGQQYLPLKMQLNIYIYQNDNQFYYNFPGLFYPHYIKERGIQRSTQVTRQLNHINLMATYTVEQIYNAFIKLCYAVGSCYRNIITITSKVLLIQVFTKYNVNKV